MTSTTDWSARPLRRDAARNHALLLDAGRAVFAARGLEATLDDVARHAGVGVGTAYRHFANKQELAAAIFSDDFDRLVESAKAALLIDDPWDAIVTFVEDTVAKHAMDRGLYEAMTATGGTAAKAAHLDGKAESMREALSPPVSELLDRGKRAGVVRGDASYTDVAAMLLMLGPTYAMSDAVGRALWRRYLHLLLDGLRAVDAPDLPVAPLDADELDVALRAAKKH